MSHRVIVGHWSVCVAKCVQLTSSSVFDWLQWNIWFTSSVDIPDTLHSLQSCLLLDMCYKSGDSYSSWLIVELALTGCINYSKHLILVWVYQSEFWGKSSGSVHFYFQAPYGTFHMYYFYVFGMPWLEIEPVTSQIGIVPLPVKSQLTLSWMWTITLCL